MIIITDVETYTADKLMYVGLSRARTGLYILKSTSAAHEYSALWIRRYENGG